MFHLVNKLNTFFFGSPATFRLKVFFKHLSWVMAGFVVARILTVMVNLVAGRWLGPHEFGLYNLGVATGGALLPFLAWGLGSANVRFSSSTPDHRSMINGTAFVLQTGLLFVGAIGLVLTRSILYTYFHISPGIFWGGLGYSVGFALFLFGVSFSQIEGRFKERAFAESGFAVVFTGLFFASICYGCRDYRAVLHALGGGYLVVGILLWFVEGKRVVGCFSREWVLPLLGFGGLWMVDMASFFLQAFLLRFITNIFLSSSDVGVLSLYSLASISAAVTFATVFLTVFLPFAAGHGRRIDLWDRLLRLSRRTFFPLLLGFVVLQLGVVVFAGKSYPFDPLFLGVMALASVLCLFQFNAGTLLSAHGVRGYLWVAGVRLGTALVFGATAFWLIPRWGLLGAGISYCLIFGSAALALLPGRFILLKESQSSSQ
jgi:O-antigen/teichoic acid export membrane protein